MKDGQDTRSNILDVAQDLVQRQSISGVSFQELANRIGIKKGSMYYHFATKDDLTIAMLDRAKDDLQASFKRGEHKTPAEQIKYFIKIYKIYIGPGEKMCPGGTFAAEWDSLSERVQASVNRVMNTQLKGVEKILVAGIENGEFTSHGQSAEELASWLISCLQGAILTGRVKQSDRPFEFAVKTIKNYLNYR